MASIKQPLGTRTALTITGLSTLASATYVASSAYNCSTNQPVDVVVEVEVATTNSPASNKQVVAFLIESNDGTNFRSGPTSGTTTTDEPDLLRLGVVPVNTSTTTHRASFSVANVLGYVPSQFKVVCKNEVGVALTGGAVYTTEVSGSVV